MTTAGYEQIVELLGDVDPLFVRRLEDTGASLDVIGEALGELEDDQHGEEQRSASSPRVAEVRAILEELMDDPEDDQDGRGAAVEGP
jgi:DNA-binding transcriptional MerR regulator